MENTKKKICLSFIVNLLVFVSQLNWELLVASNCLRLYSALSCKSNFQSQTSKVPNRNYSGLRFLSWVSTFTVLKQIFVNNYPQKYSFGKKEFWSLSTATPAFGSTLSGFRAKLSDLRLSEFNHSVRTSNYPHFLPKYHKGLEMKV